MSKKLQIFFLIAEHDQIGQNKDRTGHIYIGHVEYGEIDQAKINEIPDIVKKDSVDQVSGCAGSDKNYNDPQRQIFSVSRYAKIQKY